MRCIAILFLAITSVASAQVGQYHPLRLTATGAGVVRVRGENVMGIDWPAGGAGTVVVPLLTWADPAEVTLTINGQAVTPDILPPDAAFTDAYRTPDAAGPTSAAFNDAALIPTYGWSPGRPTSVRRGVVVAAVLSVALIALLAVVLPRRARAAGVLIASAGLCGLLPLHPQLSRRDNYRSVGVAVEEGQRDVWAYRTSEIDQIVREPWAGVTWPVPASAADLRNLAPVLILNPAGEPEAIDTRVAPGRFAVFLHRFDANTPITLEDAVPSTAMARRVYGRPAHVRGEWTVIGDR